MQVHISTSLLFNYTVHKMHNTTTWNEMPFASKLDSWYNYYLSNNRIDHYAINSLLYFRTLRREIY